MESESLKLMKSGSIRGLEYGTNSKKKRSERFRYSKCEDKIETVLRDRLRNQYVSQLQKKNKNLIGHKTLNLLKLATAEAERTKVVSVVTTAEIEADATPLGVYTYLSSNKISTKKPVTIEEELMQKYKAELKNKFGPDANGLMDGIVHYKVKHEINTQSTQTSNVHLNRKLKRNELLNIENIHGTSSLDYIRAKRALDFNQVRLDDESQESADESSASQYISEAVRLDKRKIQDLLLLSQVRRGVLPINLLRSKNNNSMATPNTTNSKSVYSFTFDISNDLVGDDHGACIGNCLSSIHTIQSIDLANNRLTSSSLPVIIGNMTKLSLKCLNLSQNKLSGVGCVSLSQYFSESNSIEKLSVSNCELNNTDVKQLCSSLSSFKQALCDLDISSNIISIDGVYSIKEYLGCSNCGLKTLNISWNELSTIGGKLLAEAIKVNTSLQNLDLSANGITDDAGQIIINSLQDNSTLEMLNLSMNKISSRSCFVLARILRHFKTLQVIDLSQNPLGEPGGRCLFREQIHCTTNCKVLMHDAIFDVDDSVFRYSNPEFVSPYELDLSIPFHAAVLDELITIVQRKSSTAKFESVTYKENSRTAEVPISLVTSNREVMNKTTNTKWIPPAAGTLKINFTHRIMVSTEDSAISASAFLIVQSIISKARTSADRNKFLRLIFEDINCTTAQLQSFLDNLKKDKVLRPGDIEKMDVFVAAWCGIVDSENKFSLLFAHFSKDERKELAHIITNEQYKFIWANATGYYNLNLSNVLQYNLMLQISAINTVESDYGKINASKRGDTSQMGNWFNFRNERYNNSEFCIDSNFLYRIPRQNRICFDYVSTSRPSSYNGTTITTDELTDMLQCLGLSRAKRLASSELGFILIELQLACAKYYFLTKDVMLVLEAFLLAFNNDPRVHAKVVITLFSRIWDIFNIELIMNLVPQDSCNEIARRLGWLNIMNPLKPSHYFILPMKYLDNRIIIVTLLELSGHEGGDQVRMAPHTDISLVNLYGRIGRIIQITNWKETTTLSYCEFGEQTKQVAWNNRRELVKKFLMGSQPLHEETFRIVDVYYKELDDANALGLGPLDTQYREFKSKIM